MLSINGYHYNYFANFDGNSIKKVIACVLLSDPYVKGR